VSEENSLIAVQHEGRRRFLELVADVRPELHRYCARMTGSVADGEDIVQDTLARAYYLLPEMDEVPAFRPWLFRIAHNRALDHLRSYGARMGEPLEAVQDSTVDPAPDPGDDIARQQAVQAAVSRFVELAPAQRSCVILKDVLGHSLDEIGDLLELSLPSVKAALHRGRARLRELKVTQPTAPPPRTSPAVTRYVALFNARDWDGVRAMLAEDVQLDLVSRAQRAGRIACTIGGWRPLGSKGAR
jgi:RNA polymerase sigma factor (sigma-70 family)